MSVEVARLEGWSSEGKKFSNDIEREENEIY